MLSAVYLIYTQTLWLSSWSFVLSNFQLCQFTVTNDKQDNGKHIIRLYTQVNNFIKQMVHVQKHVDLPKLVLSTFFSVSSFLFFCIYTYGSQVIGSKSKCHFILHYQDRKYVPLIALISIYQWVFFKDQSWVFCFLTYICAIFFDAIVNLAPLTTWMTLPFMLANQIWTLYRVNLKKSPLQLQNYIF